MSIKPLTDLPQIVTCSMKWVVIWVYIGALWCIFLSVKGCQGVDSTLALECSSSNSLKLNLTLACLVFEKLSPDRPLGWSIWFDNFVTISLAHSLMTPRMRRTYPTKYKFQQSYMHTQRKYSNKQQNHVCKQNRCKPRYNNIGITKWATRARSLKIDIRNSKNFKITTRFICCSPISPYNTILAWLT